MSDYDFFFDVIKQRKMSIRKFLRKIFDSSIFLKKNAGTGKVVRNQSGSLYNSRDGCKRSAGTQTYFTESDHKLRSMRNRIDDGFRIITSTALTTFCLSRDVRKPIFGENKGTDQLRLTTHQSLTSRSIHLFILQHSRSGSMCSCAVSAKVKGRL